MPMTSTNELLLATLQFAYDLGVSLALATFYTSVNVVDLVEQVSRTQKKHPFRSLWLLGGGLVIGSIFWLIQLISLQGFIVPIISLVATGLLVLLMVAISRIKQLTRLGESTQEASKALTESEDRFRAIFEQAGVAIGQVGANGEFLRVNQKLCDITGYRREELLKKTIFDITYPEDQIPTQLYLRQFSNWQTQTLKLEKRYIHKKGSIVWVNVTVSLVREPSGAPKYFIGVIEDITERKQAREALRRREEYFRSLIENASDIITILNRDGTITYESPSIQRILGHDPQDLVGQNIVEFVHPEDTQSVVKCFADIVEHRSCGPPVEFRFWHRNGSWHTLEAIGQSLLDELGEVKIVVNARDITERTQAEAAVQRASRDKSNILESITEAFIAVDHEWRFTYINAKAEQVLSQKAEQLLGKCVWDELPWTVSSQIEKQFRRAVAEQVSIKFEEFYSPLNIWFLVRAYPYEGGLAVYCSDISERKRAEASILERSHLSTLAAKVGVALAEGGTLPAILQRCTEAMVEQLNATSATVWTLNAASQQLEQQAGVGQRAPLNPDLINLVSQIHQPYLTTKQLEDLHSCFLPNHYPLVVEDRLIGVISVLGNQPLTEEAHRTLSWVANAIAVAIDRYWARTELLTRRESLLFGLANQIRNSLELDTILETAVQSIRQCLQIDRCYFMCFRNDEAAPYWDVVNEARNPLLPSHLGKYTTEQVAPLAERLLNRQIIRVDEVETFSEPVLRQLLLSLGYTSILSIPIEIHAGEIGVICCSHCTGVRPWDDSEVELLQAVVVQLAIALDQAELYAQARETARTAQAQAKQLKLALNQLQATQAKLVQSEKMSSLGQLVAGVAHEINNPVNFIHNNIAYASAYVFDLMGLLRLYQEHCPNPAPTISEQVELINLDFIASDLPKLLGSMQRGTDRIRSIVLSLRNFSRLDEADMKKVDVHEGIESTLLILQHRLKAKGEHPEIQIFKEYSDLPLVECYPGELNQVFMNILINAIEALKPSELGNSEYSSCLVPNPSPAITIRTSTLDNCELDDSTQNSVALITEHERYKTKSSRSVVIRISDNGPGITESVKARLFDPFFTTKPVGKGTGLGLSISYQIIVEHHHGVLTCTSTPGQGTEFWIEIPIQQLD
jgi:PAS domain S-box-containing protein